MGINEENTLNKEKALKQLKNSYEMYERTKLETERRMKEALNSDGTKKFTNSDIKNQLELISGAQDDIVSQYVLNGGNEDDLKKKSKKKKINIDTKPFINVNDIINETNSINNNLDKEISSTMTNVIKDYIPKKGEYDPESAFDVIPLPSKGEGYKDKISKMSVSYLTAYDENMIVSPNLYRDNLIIDYILQEKVLSKSIEPIDLLEGDRDAIILFLRASGYGNEYPITVTDDVTGKEFESVIDLSKLKYKEFNLKGDSNGWFTYILPISGKEIKFRFPTHRDNVILEKMQESEENKTRKGIIKNYVDNLDIYIENDKLVSNDEKIKIRQAIRTLERWSDSIDNEETIMYNHSLTNKLNLLIMSVDGITDKSYINEFIRKMPVKDSSSLRRYIQQNEPGIDYNIEVEKPLSLGGGSIKTFLQLDQFLFLNIS